MKLRDMKWKRCLSVVLVCALVLSTISIQSVRTNAAEQEVTYKEYKATDTTYSLLNLYSQNTNNENYNGDKFVATNSLNGTAQTGAGLEFDGYLLKYVTPYVAWIVEAQKAGEYTFKATYQAGNISGEGDTYTMAMSVNDDKYYYGTTLGTDMSGKWKAGDVFSVELKQGRNVVRLLPSGGSDWEKDEWVNIYSLEVEENTGLTVIENAPLTLAANASDYISHYSNKSDGDGLGGVSIVDARNAKITFDTLTKDNLSKMPYFSYTVEAPEDGYYDITINYGSIQSNTKASSEGYFIVRVNGQNYKRGFELRDNQQHPVNASVYLMKGTNTVTVTSMIATDGYWETYSSSQGYPTWCNIGNIIFSGGVTKEATQIDPTTYEDAGSTTLVEAEENGILWRYTANGESGKSNTLVGNISHTGISESNAVSFDDLRKGWLDYSQSPSVTYMVNVSKAGVYTIKNVYYLKTNTDVDAHNYYMTIGVNDNLYKKAKVEPYTFGAVDWCIGQVEVELEAGYNVIRMITTTRDTFSMINWLNQDYMQIYGPGTVTAVAPQTTHLQSGESEFISNFNSKGSSESAFATSFLQGYQGSVAKKAGITFDNIDANNYEKLSSLGYFAYTVEAPKNGYYDMQTYIDTGSEGTGYLILIVDGVKYQKKVSDWNQSGTWLDNQAQNLTTYLTKGTHTVLVSGVLGHTGSADPWCDMASLTVHGGITKAAVQMDPLKCFVKTDDLTNAKKMEAETDGIAHRFSTIGDKNVSGLTVDASALQSAAELKSRGLNKSTNAYIAYTVNAPSTGTYTIQPMYEAEADHYAMTIVVNNGGAENLYQVSAGKAVNVELQAGQNVIYTVPVVSENATALTDIVIDGLVIDTELQAVKPQSVTLKASAASFKGNYWNTVTNDYIGGARSTTNAAVTGKNLDTLAIKDIKDISYFTYTVSAPADGYYDISLKHNIDGSVQADSCFGYFVDDQLYTLFADYTNSEDYRLANATVYLEAGIHTLTFTQNLKKGTQEKVYWTDFYEVSLSGGLKRADYQIDAVEGGKNRMEAEQDASSYYYFKKSTSADKAHSGAQVLGSVDRSFDWSYLQTTDELKESFNWSKVPSVTYVVVAPEDGTYEIQPEIITNNISAVTIRVNEGNVYECKIDLATSGTRYTPTVEVKLVKGRNIITVLSYTKASYYKDTLTSWSDHDCLRIDARLTGVKLEQDTETLYPGKSQYLNYCGVNSSNSNYTGNANSNDAIRAKLTAESITNENVRKTVHYAFTVTAPEAGYYEITEKVNTSTTIFEYYSILANGKNFVGKKTNAGLHFSVYLNQGDNVLVFVGALPRDEENVNEIIGVNSVSEYTADLNYYTKIQSVYTKQWFDFQELKLTGGLTLAEEQVNPYHTYKIAQAENTAETIVNNYTRNDSGVGSGTMFQYVQAVEELQTKYFDKHDNAYVAVVVDAPEAGEYAIKARVKININQMNEAYRAYTECPQVTFVVNGGYDVVQAAYSGANAEWSETEALVKLKEGRNVIYVLPVTGEMIDFTTSELGGSNKANSVWADVDYVGVDNALTIINPSTQDVTVENAPYLNLYKDDDDDILNNAGEYGLIEKNQIAISTLTRRTMANVPYFSYTVNAPTEGYYDITLNAQHDSNYSTYGLLIDGATYGIKSNSASGFRKVDFSVYLTEGEHVLVFTVAIPEEVPESYKDIYSDFKTITISGGLTLSETHKNPAIHLAEKPLEAEKALISNYTICDNDEFSGKKYLGGGTGVGEVSNPQYGDDSYVAYAVYAPTKEAYDVALGYKVQKKVDSLTVLVNGKSYSVACSEDATADNMVESTITVTLKAGVNIIQCLDVTDAGVDYDYLKIQDELSEADINAIVVCGDANFDPSVGDDDSERAVDAADLVHAKWCAKGEASVAYDWILDFDEDGKIVDGGTESGDLQLLRKVIVGAKPLKTLKVFDQIGALTAYTTSVLYNNANNPSEPSGYTETFSAATVKAIDAISTTADVKVTVDTNTVCQTVEGFGASITDSSAYNLELLGTKNKEKKDAAMASLFSEDGLGLTFLRQPLGASDFVAEEFYTYCDEAGSYIDPLRNFSIAHDEEQIIPLIKDAQVLVEGTEAKPTGRTLHIFGTPWTAPLWMKEYEDWNTVDENNEPLYNRLKSGRYGFIEYYYLYAEYLAKAISAYKEHGIEIETMTLQNELDAVHNITSMFFDKNDVAKFGPYMVDALERYGLDTKIFGYDSSWFGTGDAQGGADRVKLFLNGDYYSGAAFHVYAGTPEVQKIIYDEYTAKNPDFKVYVTEAAGNTSYTNFFKQMKYAMGGLNNGASAYIMWNVMLDSERGPIVGGVEEYNPWGIGLLELNEATNDFSFTSDYYVMAHFSKYIKPGAKVTKSTVDNDSVSSLSAINENGTVTVVLTNQDYAAKVVNIEVDGEYYEYKLPAKSAVTINIAKEG